MFNINDNISGSAGKVNLGSLQTRHGYFEYDFGITKRMKDRLNSYLQVSLRNGGRTSVGFQFGLQYYMDFGFITKWFGKKDKTQTL